ncbi:class I SAM-dependent methyltransferase [candidate division KSB1 bacterium]|nr:class I SAM-dependent methyltransferase [candidate division KSB1 bacterium]
MEQARTFWENQSEKYSTAFEKLPELAAYLDRAERKHLFKVINVSPEMHVLDLGCGTGRWAFEFARKCKRVTAVDFAEGMVWRAQSTAEELGLNNIDFQVASVSDFKTDDKFDIILISGVLVYFDDETLGTIISSVKKLLKPGGKIISRETVAIHQRQEIRNEIHEKIGAEYSAIYRLPDEYKQMFADYGLKTLYAEDFTPTNFPMILFRKFVPDRQKNNKMVRRLLKTALIVQYGLDPVLLKNKWLYRPIMNRFWKIKSMLFIYGIDS